MSGQDYMSRSLWLREEVFPGFDFSIVAGLTKQAEDGWWNRSRKRPGTDLQTAHRKTPRRVIDRRKSLGQDRGGGC